MTPPMDTGKGDTAEAPAAPSAVSLCPDPAQSPATLRHRADFLRAASARRQGTGGFLLQARDRGDGDPAIRVGFTASKKIGNAVLRNRAKRRLRALVRGVLPPLARPGWDYVLVARPEATVTRDFAALCDDLRAALTSVHQARK
ncbi:ribonuclease P protein component [Paragemmobacter ruber]|uniref:Ribonuclease P protein component n=1 Tax=Paragemmobacter ruber TaxID=1985673 RepID=A0ABW9Y5X0_9RHOB|nr:ribonuclease P protein component [Rhodobacter ruber]NBE07589.1 ribonuclease P protein component [Rhodobacter ruber]